VAVTMRLLRRLRFHGCKLLVPTRPRYESTSPSSWSPSTQNTARSVSARNGPGLTKLPLLMHAGDRRRGIQLEVHRWVQAEYADANDPVQYISRSPYALHVEEGSSLRFRFPSCSKSRRHYGPE